MNEISISSTLSDYRLISTVTVPKDLRKYFKSFRFFAQYDAQLSADGSVLNIPLVSTVLPLAWLTGTDVHVEKLDKTYVEAMNAIKHEFKRMYPRGKFTTKMIVDDLVENKTRSQGIALLFSGGVDSTYSLIRNISLKPRLIKFWGVQTYHLDPSYKKFNLLARKTYSDFAKRQGLEINFIETNAIGILDPGRIRHAFHEIIGEAGLWRSLLEPLLLLSLPAPLSIDRFDRLLIAATVDPTHDYDKYPDSNQPRIDEKFAWADLGVIHDGYVHRFSKTSLIKDYLKENELTLKVCNEPTPDRLNCSACEKCYRTIVQLVLEGIDPNSCGFEVDRSTFGSMRYVLENKKFDAYFINAFWKGVQTRIPEKIDEDFYGSKKFLDWFRNLNIDSLVETNRVDALYKTITNMLPYPLARNLTRARYWLARRV